MKLSQELLFLEYLEFLLKMGVTHLGLNIIDISFKRMNKHKLEQELQC